MNASDIATGLFKIIQGISSNPYVVGAAALIVAIVGAFLWHWLKPWLQKAQDVKNAADVAQGTQKVEQDGQELQHQTDDLFNK